MVGHARPNLARISFNIHLALKTLIDFLPLEVYGSLPRQNTLNKFVKNRKPSYHLFVIECVLYSHSKLQMWIMTAMKIKVISTANPKRNSQYEIKILSISLLHSMYTNKLVVF